MQFYDDAGHNHWMLNNAQYAIDTSDICHSSRSPLITINSEEAKQLILIELTVPTEERIEISGELKKNKYTPILEEGKQKGGESACGL